MMQDSRIYKVKQIKLMKFSSNSQDKKSSSLILKNSNYNFKQQISIPMNTTTQMTPQQFAALIPNEVPIPSQILRLILISIVKACCELLLLYPVNLIICLGFLYWLSSNIINFYNRPKLIEYYPNSHVERYDQRVKGFKKDIREIQNEVINLNRKMQQKKENADPEMNSEPSPDSEVVEVVENSQIIKDLLSEREYIQKISSQFFAGIQISESKIFQKLKRYSEQ